MEIENWCCDEAPNCGCPAVEDGFENSSLEINVRKLISMYKEAEETGDYGIVNKIPVSEQLLHILKISGIKP